GKRAWIGGAGRERSDGTRPQKSIPAPPAGRAEGRRDRAAPATAIGIDTGGTFTDVVAWREGHRVAFKLPSTPREPAAAVLAALERAGAGQGTRVRHGSTVAPNPPPPTQAPPP